MAKTLFIAILRYTKESAIVETHRDDHIAWLLECYAKDQLIVSGPQVPKTGGVIMGAAKSREDFEQILENDPFHIHKCAEYSIYEFAPLRYSQNFAQVLDKIA